MTEEQHKDSVAQYKDHLNEQAERTRRSLWSKGHQLSVAIEQGRQRFVATFHHEPDRVVVIDGRTYACEGSEVWALWPSGWRGTGLFPRDLDGDSED